MGLKIFLPKFKSVKSVQYTQNLGTSYFSKGLNAYFPNVIYGIILDIFSEFTNQNYKNRYRIYSNRSGPRIQAILIQAKFLGPPLVT